MATAETTKETKKVLMKLCANVRVELVCDLASLERLPLKFIQRAKDHNEFVYAMAQELGIENQVFSRVIVITETQPVVCKNLFGYKSCQLVDLDDVHIKIDK